MSNNWSKDNISGSPNYNIPKKYRGEKMLDDELMNSVGLYSKKDIENARFNKFSRFGRILDPYGKVNPGIEYLFFVKPDLHICVPTGESATSSTGIYKISGGGISEEDIIRSTMDGSLILNPQLNAHPYFRDLIETHPNVIKQLQYSVSDNPFCYLLSSSVSSHLSLDATTAETMDTPATIFGTNYKYLQDSESSNEALSFSLEFLDDKELNTYHFFKAYSDYHIARKSGLVTPPNLNYYRYKRLHNTMGIYKFIVAEDMETIMYWAYIWGVIPTSCPRDAFSEPAFDSGLTFSINFESAFIEDMNPMILYQFNQLMSPIITRAGRTKDDWLPVVKTSTMHNDTKNTAYNNTGRSDIINGTLPVAALVDGRRVNDESKLRYRLRWYDQKITYNGIE